MIESDRRITPASLLENIRLFSAIRLDPCTEPDNPTGAGVFWTFHDDGLNRCWLDSSCGQLVYANVPFSRGQVELWAAKAIEEARGGCEIILLTKDDCRTAWNRLLVDNADMRCRIARGVGFLEPADDGTYRKLPGAAWGTTLWAWTRRRRRFARIFGAIGEISWLQGPQEVDE